MWVCVLQGLFKWCCSSCPFESFSGYFTFSSVKKKKCCLCIEVVHFSSVFWHCVPIEFFYVTSYSARHKQVFICLSALFPVSCFILFFLLFYPFVWFLLFLCVSYNSFVVFISSAFSHIIISKSILSAFETFSLSEFPGFFTAIWNLFSL